MSELLGLGFWFLERLSMREEVRGRWYVSISYYICVGKREEGTRVRCRFGPKVSALSPWHGISHDVLAKARRRNRKRKQKPLLPSLSHLIFPLKSVSPQTPRLFAHTDSVAHPPPPLHYFSALRTKHNSVLPRS